MYRPGQVPPQMTGFVPPQTTGMPMYGQPQMQQPQRYGPQPGVPPMASRPMVAPQATGVPGMGMGMQSMQPMAAGFAPQPTGFAPQPTGFVGAQPTGFVGAQPTGFMAPQATGVVGPQPTGIMPMATGMGMAAINDPRLRLMSSQFLPGPAMAGAGPGGIGGLGVGWNPAAQQPSAFQSQFSQYAPMAPVSNLTAPAPAPPRQAGLRWTLTPEERASYDRIFKAWDRNKTGYLDGGVAREVLGQSGLNDEVLMRIWHLADVDNRGKLNRSEFHVAMGLIYRALNGVPPPDTLPQELRTQAQRDLDDSVDFMRDLLKRNNQKSNPQRGTASTPSRAPIKTISESVMESVQEAPEKEEDPLADLNSMKAALEQSRKTLAESEAAPDAKEDAELKSEMDALRHDIRRVQQDIEYFTRRGGDSEQARGARRRAERELLQLTTERLPALERRMQQRSSGTAPAPKQDMSPEANWKGSYERQPERSASASTVSPSRTPVPTAPAPQSASAPPAPAPAAPAAPEPAAQPAWAARPSQQSTQPPPGLDAAGRAAWLKEQAQKRVQDRMRALGLLAPVAETNAQQPTGADEGLAARIDQDAEEDARRAKEAEERAAARSARWDDTQKSREAEKKARWERLAQLEREEKEAAAKAASPKSSKKASPAPVATSPATPTPPPAAPAAPAPVSSSGLPPAQRKVPGKKAAPPPPPPKRRGAPAAEPAAPAATPVATPASPPAPPPAPPAPPAPVQASPPPSASSLAPSEASATPPAPPAPPAALPATPGGTNPFFRQQAATSPPAPSAAPAEPTKSKTNPFFRSNLPPPQRATPPTQSPAPAAAAPAPPAPAAPRAPRAPVDDDDDWGDDRSEVADDDDDDGAGALGTRAGRANLAQALFGGLVPQREATPPAAPPAPPAPAAPSAATPAAPAAPASPAPPAPAAPSAPAFKPPSGPVDRNALLSQIQGGARLKHTQTKDRSGPKNTGQVLGSASPPPQPKVDVERAPAVEPEPLPPPAPAAPAPAPVPHETNPYRQSFAWQTQLASDSVAAPGAFPDEATVPEAPPAPPAPIASAAAPAPTGQEDEALVVLPTSGGPVGIDPAALQNLQLTLEGQQRALYSYTAAREEDLALTEGDVITLASPPDGTQDEGWSFGFRADGASGFFPSAYVGPIGATRLVKALYPYTPAPAADPAEADAEAELEEGLLVLALQGEEGSEWVDVLDPRLPVRVRRAPAAYLEL